MQGKCKPGQMNVTLVAYYWKETPKTADLKKLISEIQVRLDKKLSGAFTAYSMDQVHATVTGLEGFHVGRGVINENYHRLHGQIKQMNMKSFLNWLYHTRRLPIEFQIGGFDYSNPYPFTSQGLHPYIRSFAVRGSIAVAMGWPVRDSHYPMDLDSLRRCANDFNILHKYHDAGGSVDNDFFFVLGRVDRGRLTEQKIQDAQDIVRDYMAANPIRLEVGKDNLSVVGYTDTTLPIKGKDKSCQFSLDEARKAAKTVIDLYK